MKKLLLLLSVVFALVSCEDNKVYTGPYTDVSLYTIHSADWELVGRPNDINSYYRYIFNTPVITPDLYYDGSVVGYLVQNENTNQEVFTPLPYSIHKGDDVNPFWTETYTFDYMPGSIAFYIRYSDFATTVAPPTCTFRIVSTL